MDFLLATLVLVCAGVPLATWTHESPSPKLLNGIVALMVGSSIEEENQDAGGTPALPVGMPSSMGGNINRERAPKWVAI